MFARIIISCQMTSTHAKSWDLESQHRSIGATPLATPKPNADERKPCWRKPYYHRPARNDQLYNDAV